MNKTLEARKQKNREAQASYKIRQRAYVKDLESSDEHVGKEIQDLQQIHAATREECLLLRYKNSLLERILFEKGIDTQAELKRHQQQRSDPELAVLTSGPIPQQQKRNAFRLGTSDGTRNLADPQLNAAPPLYQAHMDQLEKEYEENPCTGVTSDEDLSDHVGGPDPCSERFYEQPVFQGHAPVVDSGAERARPFQYCLALPLRHQVKWLGHKR
ncbi:MAG: hypothetical protein LQ339_007769 [Xanthoria mediterranea]|nr:MAG: hypothetical protein LQ339_007769 [Xanthoria mediterranea]